MGTNKIKARVSGRQSKKCLLWEHFHQNCRDPVEYKRIKIIIENQLQSRIAEFYRFRLISQILQDDSIYERAIDLKLKREIIRLRKSLSYDEIGRYLIMYFSLEDGETLSQLIENVLNSKLKQLLIKRNSEKMKRKITQLNKKIRIAWDDLTGLLHEEDLISYALMIIRNNSN